MSGSRNEDADELPHVRRSQSAIFRESVERASVTPVALQEEGDPEPRLRSALTTGESVGALSEGQFDIAKSPRARSLAHAEADPDEASLLLSNGAARDDNLAERFAAPETLGRFAQLSHPDSSAPVAGAASVARSETPVDVSMAALFGKNFHAPERDDIPDPALLDTHTMLRDLLGISEDRLESLDVDHAELLRLKHEFTEEAALDSVRVIIGEHGTNALEPTSIGRRISSVIRATLPQQLDGSSKFLVTMPRVGGVVQTLHADPKIFAKDEPSRFSTETEHFTTSNVMRWSVVNDKPYTNTRLVMWSDGTQTLHIGPEVFLVCRNSERALNMVTSDIVLEGRNNVRANAKAAVLPFVDHWTFTAPAQIANSVNEQIVSTSNVADDIASKVGLLEGTIAPIGVQKDKNPPKNAAPPIEEQFLDELRRAQERARAKGPVSITQLIEDEFRNYEMLQQHVACDSLAGELQQLRHNKEDEAKLKRALGGGVSRHGGRGTRREVEVDLGQHHDASGGHAHRALESGSDAEDLEAQMYASMPTADAGRAGKHARDDAAIDEDALELARMRSRKEDSSASWKDELVRCAQDAISKLRASASSTADAVNADIIQSSIDELRQKIELDRDEWLAELRKVAVDVGGDVLVLPPE